MQGAEEVNEIAEILLRLQESLTVQNKRRYTTRTVTGLLSSPLHFCAARSILL